MSDIALLIAGSESVNTTRGTKFPVALLIISNAHTKLSSVSSSRSAVATRRVRLQLSIAAKKQATILYLFVREVVSKNITS
ncbi:unnamed protein product [Rhizophagus irregularis]|nr:unnamed protein product [Rhizophagus irregularis]